LVEIIDFFELPFESSLGSSQIFTGVTSSLFALGYLGLLALMFLESLSLPIPSEVFLPLVGYLIFSGKMAFAPALVVTTIGGLAGSLVIFYLGLLLGRPLVYALAERIGISRKSLGRLENWLSGKGSVVVLLARFIPGIRSSISIPAGVLKMNVIRFSVVTLVGSFGWSLLLMYIGYSLGPLSKIGGLTSSGLFDQAILYVIALASISYIIYYFIQRSGARRTNISVQPQTSPSIQ